MSRRSDALLGRVGHKDIVIIDFEGEPGRPLSERRIKRSAIRDLAGMLRSFQYAAYAALYGGIAGVTPKQDQLDVLGHHATNWTNWVSEAYLAAYKEAAGNAGFIPADAEEFRVLLNVFTLEKALYEVNYELNNRPDWVLIPLTGILKLL